MYAGQNSLHKMEVDWLWTFNTTRMDCDGKNGGLFSMLTFFWNSKLVFCSLTCQSVDSSTCVGFEAVWWTCVIYVEFTVLQHIIFPANVGIRIQMHAIVLYPCRHHNEFAHIAGHLRTKTKIVYFLNWTLPFS